MKIYVVVLMPILTKKSGGFIDWVFSPSSNKLRLIRLLSIINFYVGLIDTLLQGNETCLNILNIFLNERHQLQSLKLILTDTA